MGIIVSRRKLEDKRLTNNPNTIRSNKHANISFMQV